MVFLLLILLEAGWSLKIAAPRCTFSKVCSYQSYRISLILLHTFAKCLIALSISTSLGCRNAYQILVLPFTAPVSHSPKTILYPLFDSWSSLSVKFVHCMNRTFSLDTDPATSSCGRRTRRRTIEWDLTAEHTFGGICDELKCSVDESDTLEAHFYIRLTCPSYIQ